jgi:hypothetical protein
VIWTTQDVLDCKAAGVQYLVKARQKYLKARIDLFADRRPLMPMDLGGCTCGWQALHDKTPDRDCLYHYAAALQPWNHRLPWNCPAYYDGCNCDGGPFYERPS